MVSLDADIYIYDIDQIYHTQIINMMYIITDL